MNGAFYKNKINNKVTYLDELAFSAIFDNGKS